MSSDKMLLKIWIKHSCQHIVHTDLKMKKKKKRQLAVVEEEKRLENYTVENL